MKIFVSAALLLLAFNTPVFAEDTAPVERKIDPSEVGDMKISYPAWARRAGIEEKLAVHILVGEDGRALKTMVISHDPDFVYLLDQEVQMQIMAAEFKHPPPGVGSGSYWVTVPISFKLEPFEAPKVKLASVKYPEDAQAMGQEGWVGLSVPLDEQGKITDAKKITVISRNPPFSNVFDEAAIDTAARSTYKPAMVGGKPGPALALIKVEFSLGSYVKEAIRQADEDARTRNLPLPSMVPTVDWKSIVKQ